jgi:hypothetical protein
VATFEINVRFLAVGNAIPEMRFKLFQYLAQGMPDDSWVEYSDRE